MQDINNQYEKLFNILKNKIDFDSFKGNDEQNKDYTNYTYRTETADIFRDIISKIIHLDLEMEICGYWLWVEAKKEHKEILKSAGFRLSPNKCKWYWRNEEYKSFNRNRATMEQIRDKYGSVKVQNQSRTRIDQTA
jgi:hypothetical protein